MGVCTFCPKIIQLVVEKLRIIKIIMLKTIFAKECAEINGTNNAIISL